MVELGSEEHLWAISDADYPVAAWRSLQNELLLTDIGADATFDVCVFLSADRPQHYIAVLVL